MKTPIRYIILSVFAILFLSLKNGNETDIPMDEKVLGKAFTQLLQSDKPSYSGRLNPFVVQKKYIQFDIDASYDPFRTALNLWLDGKIVRTQTGKGQGISTSVTWDVSEYKGKTVHLQIVDADPKPDKTIKIASIVQSDDAKNTLTGAVADEIKKAKIFAINAIKANLKKAAADDNRPVYHFRPPSQRMNDPNGTFYANGYYHLFYQHNPLADFAGGGYMLWGHARSKDMVTWEQLPIALWPNWEMGELHCYSGGAYKKADGQQMLFYTGVPAPGEPRQQWAAVATDNTYKVWKNYTAEPVLKYYPKNSPDPGLSWRDPFVFGAEGKTFALLTTNQGVGLYQANDVTLTNWTFKNIIYKTKGAPECPNFFKFGHQWMLIVSPQNPVEYVVGTFDAQSGKFSIENKGVLNGNAQYYATQGLVDAQGNQILFGLVKGFKNGKGWRDCLALPRILTLDKDGNPLQYPIPALKSLRKNEKKIARMPIVATQKTLTEIKGDVLEIEAEFEPGDAKAFGIKVRGDADGQKGFEIRYANEKLLLPGTKVEAIPLLVQNGKVNFHVFIDKGVIEIYAGNGHIAEVRVFYAPKGNNTVSVFADGGTAILTQLKAYELSHINQNYDIQAQL